MEKQEINLKRKSKLTTRPDETAFELFRRVQSRPFETGLAFLDECSMGRRRRRGLLPGDVVELYGPSGAGKTEVLMNAVVQFSLSKKAGGAQKTAIYFDHDCRLNLKRLELLAREKIKSCAAYKAGLMGDPVNPIYQRYTSHPAFSRGSMTEEDPILKAHVLDCLSRIKVVRSSNNLEAAAYLNILHHQLRGSAAFLLAIDSLGSFYWKDKLVESCASKAFTLEFALMRGLARLLKERSVIILASKPVMMPTKTMFEHKEFMPSSWQRMVTSRLLLLKEDGHSNQYPTQMNSCTVVHVKSVCNMNELQQQQLKQRQNKTFIINDVGTYDLK